MFELLTQILLWLLIGVIAWYILKQFIQPAFYTTLGFFVMVALLVLAFFEPDAGVISEAWSVLSLPLRPLGFALFTLIMMIKWAEVRFDGKTFQNRQLWVFLTLFLSSMPVTAYWLSQQVEQPVAEAIGATAGQTAPVMVVLAQGTTRPAIPPRTQIELTESGDRLRYASEIFFRTGAPTLIVTGNRRSDVQSDDGNRLQESNEAIAVLTSLGVPRGNIIVENNSGSIKKSADAVRAVLTDEAQGLTGVRSLILVSSALNMQRASATFEKTLEDLGGGAGIQIIPRATDFYTVQEEGDFRHKYQVPQDLVPNEHALAQTGDLVQEYLTQIYYLLRGWLTAIS
ncbi:MAG: YdcF family protein [Prochlorotrichaceae cyanobacterium]